jgi:hypothetical protein
MRPATTTDDAGKAVEVYNVHAPRDEADAGDPALPELRQRFAGGLKAQGFWDFPIEQLIFVVSLIACLVVMGILRSTGVIARNSGHVGYWLIYAWMFIGSIWVSMARRRHHADRIVVSMLAEGRCAACAYVLAGLGADGEGLVQCPECGARWRKDRVGEAVPALARATATSAVIELGHWPGVKLARRNRNPVILDADGRILRLADLRLAARQDPEVARLRRAVMRKTRPIRFVLAAVCLAVGGVYIFFATRMRWGIPIGMVPTLMSIGGTLFLVFFAAMMLWQAARLLRGQTRFIRTPAIAHLVAARRCPACVGTLAPEAARAGALRCTVCRSVW